MELYQVTLYNNFCEIIYPELLPKSLLYGSLRLKIFAGKRYQNVIGETWRGFNDSGL